MFGSFFKNRTSNHYSSQSVNEIKTIKDFEEALNKKNDLSDLIIFKFSPYCSLSLSAEKRFYKWLNQQSPALTLHIYRVDVIQSRQLSNYIEEYFTIKHESPQLIWLSSQGEVKWNGSHFQISDSVLNEVLNFVLTH